MTVPGEKLPYLQLDPPLAIPRRAIERKDTLLPSIGLNSITKYSS